MAGTVAQANVVAKVKSPRERVLRRLSRNPSGVAGFAMLVVFVLVAAFGPALLGIDPTEQTLRMRLMPPSPEHLFGTDHLGRDVLARVIHGARISLQVATLVILVAITIGVTLGAVAGYAGGLVDTVIMRVTDIFLSFPSTVLAMAIAVALGKGMYNAMLAVGLVWWPWYTRLVRGQMLSLRSADYVQAAESQGLSPFRIVWRHILPNTLSTIVVQASLDVGYAVLATAGLSFIGLGAQPPTPEWGVMVSEGRQYLTSYWWVPMLPGMAIFFTVMGVNLFGDALRDAMDPRDLAR
ncbi:MAG: ABC transporter permease [Bacillota bacterium]|nr:ABC transporter permease [Bacillota bacterium]